MTKKVFADEQKRPRAPAWLPKLAKGQWRNIVNALPVDWFRDSDLPLLESYCLHYSQMRECQQTLEAEGLVIIDTSGNRREHPSVRIMGVAVQRMNMIATKLKICPNARVSGAVAGGAKSGRSLNNSQSRSGKSNVRPMFGT